MVFMSFDKGERKNLNSQMIITFTAVLKKLSIQIGSVITLLPFIHIATNIREGEI